MSKSLFENPLAALTRHISEAKFQGRAPAQIRWTTWIGVNCDKAVIKFQHTRDNSPEYVVRFPNEKTGSRNTRSLRRISSLSVNSSSMFRLGLGRSLEFFRRKRITTNNTSMPATRSAPTAPPTIAGAELPLGIAAEVTLLVDVKVLIWDDENAGSEIEVRVV